MRSVSQQAVSIRFISEYPSSLPILKDQYSLFLDIVRAINNRERLMELTPNTKDIACLFIPSSILSIDSPGRNSSVFFFILTFLI